MMNIIIVLFCLIPLSLNAFQNPKQYILFEDAEFPKVCSFNDGLVYAFGSVLGEQKTLITKFDKYADRGEDTTLKFGYSGSSVVAQSLSDNNLAFFFHNKKGIANYVSKEYVGNIKNDGKEFSSILRKDKIYIQKSVVPLENGKIIIAGIYEKNNLGEQTTIEIDIYDPSTGSFGNGITIAEGQSDNAYGKYISCFKLKPNDVYCAYVSYESEFISKLNIRHLKITVNGLDASNPENTVVKNFYTPYNFIKVIPYNEKEAIILFQTGNEGKDLYYYHITLENDEMVAKRYEYLFNNCLYQSDPEHQNADIIYITKNKIYATCEYTSSKFMGFEINPDLKKIKTFEFYNFGAKSVRTPVFAKFGTNLALFYNFNDIHDNKKIAYYILNYPDCEDYEEEYIPRYNKADIALSDKNKIFLSNHDTDIHSNSEVNYKITTDANVTIYIKGTHEKLVLDKEYDKNTKFTVSPDTSLGEYNIYFTPVMLDEYDDLIEGKTCRIKCVTPECLKQCYSCTKKGNDAHHYCLGCAERYYPEDDKEGEIARDGSKTHNCYPCDEACVTCKGPLTPKTTNCNLCDYENNFYPFEDDASLCIHNKTQKKWEGVLKRAIYLDKSGGDSRQDWVWRKCHEHCSRCEEGPEPGNEKCLDCINNIYFYWNQDIPGSCHDCKDNGYFVRESEDGRQKCYPCFKNCKVCPNGELCYKCFPGNFLTNNGTSCDKSCGYCLVEDRENWECVNCKDQGKYTLDGQCIDEKNIPTFTYQKYVISHTEAMFNNKHQAIVTDINVVKPYHVVDEKCRLLDACKEGCKKCKERFSDQCTECEEDYYRHDYGYQVKKESFKCYTKDTCIGIAPNPFVKDRWEGGVNVLEDGEKVCLNCKIRNGTFRLPENDFYCGNEINRTFVDIEEYNKLSYCYTRCKTCKGFGNACFMNCDSCRDSKYYDLILGNCYRKSHKCGLFPYYHDYDLAPPGREDNCGEDCDVCLKSFNCPKEFPFFVFDTHECVEYCPFHDVLGEKCNANNSVAVIILLSNPFGFQNPYDILTKPLSINQFMSSSLFEYISNTYSISKEYIQNIIGSGNSFNLPQSQIIFGNNISIEITTNKLEKEKLLSYNPSVSNSSNTSIVDLSGCESVLKSKYGIPEDEDLIILKGDQIQEFSEVFGVQVDYAMFSTSLGAFLPLSACEEESQPVTVTNPFSTFSLVNQYQSKLASVVSNGYDAFDVDSPFYHDVCTPFTNENGNDVLLDARRQDYFFENINLCEKNCKFIGFNTTTQLYSCRCNIKVIPGQDPGEYDETQDSEIVEKEVPEGFKLLVTRHSNIEVFKCASQVFSAEGQKKNYGSYILLASIASLIGVIIFHFIKENKKIDSIFSNLIHGKVVANPPNPGKTKKKVKKAEDEQEDVKEDKKEDVKEDEKKEKKKKKKKKIVNELTEGNLGQSSKNKAKKSNLESNDIIKDYVITDTGLNFLSYQSALERDKRTFLQNYWSFLKMKQICIFTFYTYDDYILRSTKIILFILFFSFYFAFTALFFNDSIMRSIYKYQGNTNAAIHIPNIVLSSLCSIVMSIIVRFVSLNERDINKISCESNKDNRKALANQIKRITNIKIIVLYALSLLLSALCWYYVSAFCAVFKNSQGAYLINVLVSFIVLNAWPCVTSLIPTFLRRKSLDQYNRETMYKISQIISIF